MQHLHVSVVLNSSQRYKNVAVESFEKKMNIDKNITTKCIIRTKVRRFKRRLRSSYVSFCHSFRHTGVIIRGPSFFPDLFVQGLKNGKRVSLKMSLNV